MQTLRKRLSALLVLCLLVIGLPIFPVDAAARSDVQILQDLNLINPEVTDQQLDATVTRLEAARLFLRLLGLEDEAEAFAAPEGFIRYRDCRSLKGTDLAITDYLQANPQLGFLPLDARRFGPAKPITAAQYKQWVLVALGFAGDQPGLFGGSALDKYGSYQPVIVASSDSPAWLQANADLICVDGEIPASLRAALRLGDGIFRFAPGTYWIDGTQRTLTLGDRTRISGYKAIRQPINPDKMLYPDAAKMAVFATRTELSSRVSANREQIGLITTEAGASDCLIEDIALSGYTVLKLNAVQRCLVRDVLIHNYRGTYPNGEWCNMGYGNATASLWIYGACNDVSLQRCQVQCSSHHGYAIHSGTNKILSRNIDIIECRALYAGCGQLRGETPSEWASAAAAVPETEGYGYRDWSVAFDLCENQAVENVSVIDCYALEGWKCGFYTEPEETGGPVKNLTLTRCVSKGGGQRAVLAGSDPKVTVVKETEGANFFLQGGSCVDCVSIDGEKCGWYLDSNRPAANPSGNGKTELIRCGDIGSPISLVTEMFDCSEITAERFWSVGARQALWLFGGNPADNWPGNGFLFSNLRIISSPDATLPPIRIGGMLRLQLTESRDARNQARSAPGGTYDNLRAHLTESSLSGRIYGLPEDVPAVQIIPGATFNGFGAGDENAPGNGINLRRIDHANCNIAAAARLYKDGFPFPGGGAPAPRYAARPLTGTKSLNGSAASQANIGTSPALTLRDFARLTVQALQTPTADGKNLIKVLVEKGAIPVEAALATTLYVLDTVLPNFTYVSRRGFTSYKTPSVFSNQLLISFDATPTANNIDGVIAYSDRDIASPAYGTMAMLVRFYTNGLMDVRNGGGGQQRLVDIPYAAGQTFHIEIVAHIPAQTYSVWVTPANQARQQLAKDFAFRNTAAALTNDIGQVFFISDSGDGAFRVTNHTMSGS